MSIVASGHTYIGLRENNEDRFCVDDAHGLYAVADGMGGHHGGEIASATAIRSLQGFFERSGQRSQEDREVAATRLDMAFRLAHRDVVAKRKGDLAEMATTLAALRIVGDRAIIAHVGDSRVYRRRGRTTSQLTRDHSLEAELEAAGLSGHPRATSLAHVVTRGIGFGDGVEADVQSVDVLPGDVFVLCSDGISDVMDADRLGEVASSLAPDFACAALVGEALSRGSRDNLTAIVIHVPERPPPARD